MAHFAKVENGTVTQVIVAEPEFIATGALGDPASWVQTSYNTQGGVHLLGGEPLRGNFAGIGYSYDEKKDAFIPPKPFKSWKLNATTFLWEAPVAMPEDGKLYTWNEKDKAWDEVVPAE